MRFQGWSIWILILSGVAFAVPREAPLTPAESLSYLISSEIKRLLDVDPALPVQPLSETLKTKLETGLAALATDPKKSPEPLTVDALRRLRETWGETSPLSEEESKELLGVLRGMNTLARKSLPNFNSAVLENLKNDLKSVGGVGGAPLSVSPGLANKLQGAADSASPLAKQLGALGGKLTLDKLSPLVRSGALNGLNSKDLAELSGAVQAQKPLDLVDPASLLEGLKAPKEGSTPKEDHLAEEIRKILEGQPGDLAQFDAPEFKAPEPTQQQPFQSPPGGMPQASPPPSRQPKSPSQGGDSPSGGGGSPRGGASSAKQGPEELTAAELSALKNAMGTGILGVPYSIFPSDDIRGGGSCHLTVVDKKRVGDKCLYAANTAAHCEPSSKTGAALKISSRFLPGSNSEPIDVNFYRAPEGLDFAMMEFTASCDAPLPVIPLASQIPQGDQPIVVKASKGNTLVGRVGSRLGASQLGLDLRDPRNGGLSVIPGDSGGGVYGIDPSTGKMAVFGTVVTTRVIEDRANNVAYTTGLGTFTSDAALAWGHEWLEGYFRKEGVVRKTPAHLNHEQLASAF